MKVFYLLVLFAAFFLEFTLFPPKSSFVTPLSLEENLTVQHSKHEGLVEKLAVIDQLQEERRTSQLSIETLACLETGNTWHGAASFYSHDGCLGCHPQQIMANGETFNENDFTLAYMRAPLNSYVRITNFDNGKTAVARVTDTGGFEALGRIADLSKGLAEEIELRTDQSTLKIAQVDCEKSRRYLSFKPKNYQFMFN